MTTKFCAVLAFFIVFICSATCDYCGKIFTEKRFIFKTENYPGTYPQFKNCYYLIRGEPCTKFFQFEFVDFDIKNSVGCTDERLEVGQQDVICGAKNGTKMYKAENGELKLKFVSTKPEERDIFNKGFKIYIKRVECPSNSVGVEDTTQFHLQDIPKDDVPFEWTTSIVPTTLSTPTYLTTNIRQCCNQNLFNSKSFQIVSPNFPFSLNQLEECSYVLTKNNPDVCRLRIHLKFFYLGQTTYNSCQNGYLEIDGKYICGCNSNVNLISNFGYSNTKILNFKTFGIPVQNSYSGFVLEVIQDECPKKYRPDNMYLPPVQVKAFRSYEDTNNRIKWPNSGNSQVKLKQEIDIKNKSDTDRVTVSTKNSRVVRNANLYGQFWRNGAEIEKAKLLGEKSYITKPGPNEISNDLENIMKYVYYFAPEGDDHEIDIDVDQNINPEMDITTNYIDTSKINTILANMYEYQKCCQWNQDQLINLRSQYGNNLEATCRLPQKDTNFDKSQECNLLNSINGDVKSPNYPYGYPEGLNLCYRFQILPGYCEIKLLFNDFHLENSQDCRKDYLQLTGNGYRYCGNILHKTTYTLNAIGNPAPEIRFVSDFYNSGRGFFVNFYQIPCNTYYNNRGNTPVSPILPFSLQYPSDSSSSIHKKVLDRDNIDEHRIKPLAPSPSACDKIIQAETFVWRDADLNGSKECNLKIEKVKKDFCKLNLTFNEFNLKCGQESILIGSQEYCGSRSGETVELNQDTTEKLVKYRINSDNPPKERGRFTIFGRQLSKSCGSNDLTIVRFADIPEIQRKPDTAENLPTTTEMLGTTLSELH